MTTQLDVLRKGTAVVADTADFALLAQFRPEDATTNPSLILQGAANPKYQGLVEAACRTGLVAALAKAHKQSKAGAAHASTLSSDATDAELAAALQGHDNFCSADASSHVFASSGFRGGKLAAKALSAAMDDVAVRFGCEILKLIPGRVSTEVDARLSYDTAASVKKARKLVAMYAARGIDKSRLYIKLAATWQGIRAAEVLEKEGINCNLTLLFSFAQAVACAQANVALISPFVGRIMDWYVAKHASQNPKEAAAGKKKTYPDASTDPGVVSVKRIYSYYKAHGHKTIVMAASFRNTGEVLALRGVDKVTVSPGLLKQMAQTPADAKLLAAAPLTPASAAKVADAKLPPLTESEFLLRHGEDPMAVEKLAEGIRNFAVDTVKLERLMAAEIGRQYAALVTSPNTYACPKKASKL